MKLKYKKCLELLQTNIDRNINHNNISKIIGVSSNALSNRLSNDGFLKENELEKIEKFYDINLSACEYISVTYYPYAFRPTENDELFCKKQACQVNIPIKCFDNFSPVKKYFLFDAFDDSMSPYIQNNDKIIIEDINEKRILNDKIYVFNYNDIIYVKRLVNNIDQIVIKSDNEIYPTRFLEGKKTDNISIIGQVVGLTRKVK